MTWEKSDSLGVQLRTSRKNIEFEGNYSKFDIYYKGEKAERIILNVPGEHNILNALASIALCRDRS